MRFCKLAIETGKRVRKIRTGLNLCEKDFAVLCHISLDQLYAIEGGGHNLCDFTIIKICHHTNTHFEVLLGGLHQLVSEKEDAVKVK